MKFVSKTLCLAVAGAALLLAGCSKTPLRPMPSQTMLGTGVGPAPSAPIDIPTTLPGSGLELRTDDFDPVTGLNRVALQANTIYFDYDSSSVKASEREKLTAVKAYLDTNPDHRLLLEGHCDWRGTAEYNLALGDRRSASVKKLLESLGVPATRLETISKGSLDAVRNADEATAGKDRRVDIIVGKTRAPGTAPL